MGEFLLFSCVVVYLIAGDLAVHGDWHGVFGGQQLELSWVLGERAYY